MAYDEAIRAGYALDWVHNNRAFSLMQFGQNVISLLKQALESAQLAREISPLAREIRLNWVLARFLVAMEGKPKAFDDPECLQELKAALADGPVDADLCIKAAWILAASGSETHDEAIQFLRKAVNLGKIPKAMLQDPFLRIHLANHPDFPAISKLTPGPKPRTALQLQLMPPVH